MRKHIADGLALVGVVLVAVGAWQIWPPLLYILLGGVFIMMGCAMIAKEQQEGDG